MMENVNSSLRRLHSLTSKLKYTGEFDADRMRVGDAYCLLPICNFALLHYSPNLALEISNVGVELYGVSDAKFVEGFYRIMRDIFNYQPKIKQTQFLSSSGFAEKKISLVADIINVILLKYPAKVKSKVVAASRVFPPSKSVPPNMVKVERSLPSMLSGSSGIGGIDGEELPSSFSQPIPRQGVAPILPSHIDPTVNVQSHHSPNLEQNYFKSPDQRSESWLQGHQGTNGSDISSINRNGILPNSTSSDQECPKCRRLEKQTESFTEAIDTLSTSFSSIALKLERLCSFMESSTTRQLEIEKKVDQILKSSSSQSDSMGTLDNLSARTSLLETKLQLLEEASTYNVDRVTSKTSDTSRMKKIHDTSVKNRTQVPVTSEFDNSVSSGRGDISFTHLAEQEGITSMFRSNVLLGSKENLYVQNTSGISEMASRNVEAILHNTTETNGRDANRSVTQHDFTENRNSIGDLNNQIQKPKGMQSDSVMSSTNGGEIPAMDGPSKAPVDSSLLLMPSSLNEQKARIEALFMETSSALKVPLASGVDKENLSRNSSFDREPQAE